MPLPRNLDNNPIGVEFYRPILQNANIIVPDEATILAIRSTDSGTSVTYREVEHPGVDITQTRTPEGDLRVDRENPVSRQRIVFTAPYTRRQNYTEAGSVAATGIEANYIFPSSGTGSTSDVPVEIMEIIQESLRNVRTHHSSDAPSLSQTFQHEFSIELPSPFLSRIPASQMATVDPSSNRREFMQSWSEDTEDNQEENMPSRRETASFAVTEAPKKKKSEEYKPEPMAIPFKAEAHQVRGWQRICFETKDLFDEAIQKLEAFLKEVCHDPNTETAAYDHKSGIVTVRSGKSKGDCDEDGIPFPCYDLGKPFVTQPAAAVATSGSVRWAVPQDIQAPESEGLEFLPEYSMNQRRVEARSNATTISVRDQSIIIRNLSVGDLVDATWVPYRESRVREGTAEFRNRRGIWRVQRQVRTGSSAGMWALVSDEEDLQHIGWVFQNDLVIHAAAGHTDIVDEELIGIGNIDAAMN